MGSIQGAEKSAARRIGVTIDEWRARRAAGEKWCSGCGAWHSVEVFGLDAARKDGRATTCTQARGERARAAYEPRPRPRGRRFVEARDGDVKQARRRVNHLVDIGLLPDPDNVLCFDCGHLGSDHRHEYDHYRGYAPEHHEDVQAVCAPCHHRRERGRRGQRDGN